MSDLPALLGLQDDGTGNGPTPAAAFSGGAVTDSAATPPAVPRFSDSRTTLRGLAILLPAIAATVVGLVVLAPRPEPALEISLLIAAALLAIVAIGVAWGRPERTGRA